MVTSGMGKRGPPPGPTPNPNALRQRRWRERHTVQRDSGGASMTAEIIHKTKQNSKVLTLSRELSRDLSIEECEQILQDDLASDNPIFNEDQVDVLVGFIADVRQESMADLRQEFDDKLSQAAQQFQTELDKLRIEIDMREEMAEQRGQLKVVTSILGISGESNKTIDASEVIRKIKVQS
jgi:hypothetical protein